MPRATRSKLDLDYRIFHRTGKRVLKDRETGQKMDDLQIQAINICSDVEDHFDSYDLQDIEDEGDLLTYVAKVEENKREFRRIHSQIKSNLGEEDFIDKYPYYDKLVNDLNNEFKASSKKLAEIKKMNKKSVDLLESEKSEREERQIKSDRKFFVDQVMWELDQCVWEKMVNPDEVKILISDFKIRLDKFQGMYSDLNAYYGDEEHGFTLENDKLVSILRDHISAGKIRFDAIIFDKQRLDNEKKEKLENEKFLAESNRVAQAEYLEREKINNILVCAESQQFEIVCRHGTLMRKLLLDISELNDFEILDLKKR